MAYNQINCQSALENTGLAGCGNELGYIAKVLWAKSDFEIDTEANALLQATWETAINAKQIYPFPVFEHFENQDEDDVYEDISSTGFRYFVREGKMREVGYVNLALCNLQKLRSFNNVKGKLILITVDGSIIMTSPDGTKATGLTLQNFHVGGLGKTDGTTKRRTPISYGLQDPSELNDYGVAIKPTWNPLDLGGILDATIASAAAQTTSLVQFTVTRDCDGEGVDGLVQGDFNLFNGSGVAQSGAGLAFVELGSGVYKFTATASLVDGTLNLKDPSLQTTGGYESAGALTVNVP